MSESKHTPGPWTAKDEGGKYYCNHDWSADNDSAQMTSCAPVHAHGDVIALVVTDSWDEKKIDANARLIAAAPELFDALQNMLGAFDNAVRRLKMPSEFCDEAIGTARAAIAKARAEA